ncbi:hypothetical protein KHA80_01190 [Anaerobacillus sp. HL2]|nr:hypothetical protein KHA80_01190 [Anaerobacillus sp. HL2]
MYHVEMIDTVILTNQTEEYTGNLQWVINHYNVERIIVPEIMKENIIDIYYLHDKEVIGWEKGDKLELLHF